MTEGKQEEKTLQMRIEGEGIKSGKEFELFFTNNKGEEIDSEKFPLDVTSKTNKFKSILTFYRKHKNVSEDEELQLKKRIKSKVNELLKEERNRNKKIKPKDFDFSSKEPLQQITTLNQLKEIIYENFPSIWFETTVCLSACATLSLKNLNGCPSLNLVGNPSGEKTTVLSFFYGQKETYISDEFSPKAFVSHSANVSEDELEDVDLLPKIKDKILITPELAPLFEAPKDQLIANFAMLTRILDGEGLNRDSGTHGHRGYSGDYKFIWLGATTPLRSSVWNVMGKIGNRLFFLNMREKNRTDKDFLEMFSGKAYEEKVKECRGAVRSFLDNLFEKYKIRALEWDAEGDIFLLPEIIKYAKLLSKLRGSLMLWKSEEQGKYEFNFPIIEEPPRAINALYNLAKGHALINQRSFLRIEDLEPVRAVCFSSMPHDRVEFLKLLAKHEGKLTTSQIQNELNCSDETARKTMNVFKILGIVDIKSIQVDYSGTGRPMSYIEIKDEFKELLTHTQGLNDLEKDNPIKNMGENIDFFNVSPEDFIKKHGKKPNTPLLNNLENTSPSKIRGESNEKNHEEESFRTETDTAEPLEIKQFIEQNLNKGSQSQLIARAADRFKISQEEVYDLYKEVTQSPSENYE